MLRQFERGEDADEVAASLDLADDAFTGVLSSIWDRAVTRRARFRPSPRERQLMSLVAGGCTHKEAAAQMSIAVITVSGYLKSVKEKYLATHTDVTGSVSPLTAARRWASENRTRPIGIKAARRGYPVLTICRKVCSSPGNHHISDQQRKNYGCRARSRRPWLTGPLSATSWTA